MSDNQPSMVFNIHGDNIQILPTATTANQYINCNELDGKPMKASGSDAPAPSDSDIAALSRYINNAERMSYYTGKLAGCYKARELAQVVMEMIVDDDVKVDKDEMVKERFFNKLLPFAPNVNTGANNIRQQIIAEYERQKKVRRNK